MRNSVNPFRFPAETTEVPIPVSNQIMDSTVKANTGRRQYRRRSDDERIADLERRIDELKTQQAAKKKLEDPVLKEIPKVQRRLRKFAQFAMDHNRPDIANSATAFNSSLDRMLRSELTPAPRRATPPVS